MKNENSILKETFTQLLKNYTDNRTLSENFWNEIEQHYSNKKRHYHTLQHLDSLRLHLFEVKNKIQHWDAVLFTLYYHDIVYNSLKSNNEEKSAELAVERMAQISVPIHTIELCKKHILATKSHVESSDGDTNFFTDADLSALGLHWDAYTVYYQNVRKEYSIFPGFIYNSGRKKVLKHFLGMKRIYKTEYFHNKFEQQARENLAMELKILEG